MVLVFASSAQWLMLFVVGFCMLRALVFIILSFLSKWLILDLLMLEFVLGINSYCKSRSHPCPASLCSFCCMTILFAVDFLCSLWIEIYAKLGLLTEFKFLFFLLWGLYFLKELI